MKDIDLNAMTPHEMAAGLMRGDRTDMQLGYTPRNAAGAVAEYKKLSPMQFAKLLDWARGFHDGMHDAMRESDPHVERGPFRPEIADNSNYREGRKLGRAENGFFLYPTKPES